VSACTRSILGLVLVTYIANKKKSKLNVRGHRRKIWLQFYNLWTAFAKEGCKRETVVQKRLFMRPVAAATSIVAYGNFVARQSCATK